MGCVTVSARRLVAIGRRTHPAWANRGDGYFNRTLICQVNLSVLLATRAQLIVGWFAAAAAPKTQSLT